MNNPIQQTDQEKAVQTPEVTLLDRMRTELVNRGMDPSNVDNYILENSEALGVDENMKASIINSGSNTEVEDKPEEKSVKEDSPAEEVNYKAEINRIKGEISEEEKANLEIQSSAVEEKEVVEQKKPLPNTANITKIDGYPPSITVAQQSDNLVKKGDVKQSKTWQAMLIEKIEKMFGDLKGLFVEN